MSTPIAMLAYFGWVPPVEAPPGAPDAFTLSQWEAADQMEGGALVFDILGLPADNGSAITVIEYRINGGTWTSLGTILANTTVIVSGLTDDVAINLELRSTNANGSSLPSDVKNRTPTTAVFPAVSTGRLWQNPSNPIDFVSSQPFVNLVRQSRLFPGTEPQDSNGWPTDVSGAAESILMLTEVDLADTSTSMDGHYNGTFTGTGTFVVQGVGVSNVTIGAGVFDFDYATPVADGGISLLITDTDTGGDHLRDFTCVHDDNLVAFAADESALRPAWENEMGTRKNFRFMDWGDTNNSPLQTWADRPLTSFARWGTGVPLEVIVDVANRTGVGGWFCIPHEADDDYVHQFSRYIRDNLNPALDLLFEYSNELWNPLFTQYGWCATQADVVEGWGTGGTQGLQYAGKRAAQVLDIITEMFNGQSSRIERVMGVQTDFQFISEDILEAPLSVAQGNDPPYESADAVAVTGYFSGGLVDTTALWNTAVNLYTGTSPEAAYRYMYDLCRPEVDTDLNGYWTGFETLIAGYSPGPSRLVMYEGASHVTPQWVSPAPDDPATAEEMNLGFHDSDYLHQLLADSMVEWDSVGGRGEFTYFGDYGDGPWVTASYPGGTSGRLDICNDYNAGTPFSVYNIGLLTNANVYSAHHSLWNHTIGLDVNNQNVPNWMHRMAIQAGMTTEHNGTFGQFPQHADYPESPRDIAGQLQPNIGWSEAPDTGWDTDFATSAYDVFLTMADNFIMGTIGGSYTYAPTDNYPGPPATTWDGTTWVAESQELFAFADANNATVSHIYAHIHEFPFILGSETPAEWDEYLDDVRGVFTDWHELLHDNTLTNQPLLGVRMIPYGQIWAELAQDYLTGMDADDWFEDEAPHGEPNMYLIAAAVTYSAIYGEKIPLSYTPPSPLIHADIISNWATIRDVIWDRLVAYEDGSGDNRVFPAGTV